MQITRKVKMA